MLSVGMVYNQPTFYRVLLNCTMRIYARSQNLPAAAASSIETANGVSVGYNARYCRNKVQI